MFSKTAGHLTRFKRKKMENPTEQLSVSRNTNYERSLMTIEKSNVGKPAEIFDFKSTDPVAERVILGKLIIKLKEVLAKKEPEPIASSCIFVKVKSCLERVDIKDIVHIQAMADYVIIHTNLKKYTVLCTMKRIESRLSPRYFTRVHKSYIVRIDCISEIENETLTVAKHIIPIGLSYKKQLKERLNII